MVALVPYRITTTRRVIVSAAPASGPYGFPGSPALGAGLVYVGGLDGRLLAFRE